MISEDTAREQLARLSVVHSALNAARTFAVYVDTLLLDQRLSDTDLVAAVNDLLAQPEDGRLTPGRIIEAAMRNRAQRLYVHRMAQQTAEGPTVVPTLEKCTRCRGPLVILVLERKRYCRDCNRLDARELDSIVVDAEVRLYRDSEAARVARQAA